MPFNGTFRKGVLSLLFPMKRQLHLLPHLGSDRENLKKQTETRESVAIAYHKLQ